MATAFEWTFTSEKDVRVFDLKAMQTTRSICCEYCGRYCRHRTERHHVVCRGIGSGKRMDVKENLIDLGSAYDCDCHAKAQRNQITKVELWAKIAKREGRSPVWIADFVQRLLRAPKGSNVEEIRNGT